MRIIGGQHRGTKLADLAGNKTRPTADRVRESIFNILAGGRFGDPLLDGIVIDLFAGTGAMGLEALSRGGAHASFIETDGDALAVLRANIAKLKREDDCRIIAGDARKLASWRGQPATLVFADAPYESGDGLTAIAGLGRIGALAPDAVLVVETGKQELLVPDILANAGFRVVDARAYGKAIVHILKINENSPGEHDA